MNIVLDGELVGGVPEGCSLADLLAARRVRPNGQGAILRNGVALPREQLAGCALAEGDRIETQRQETQRSGKQRAHAATVAAVPPSTSGAWSFGTLAIHGPNLRREAEGATLPPVYYSTAFEHASAEAMARVFEGSEPGHVYSRLQNPTVQALEERLNACCGARGTLAVASGMSAIALGLMALLQAGDELLAGRYLFGGTYTLLSRTLAQLGIVTRFFDPRRPEEAERLVTPRTRAVLLEAIANPAMVVPDFAAYRALCERHHLPLLADATLPTPYLFDAKALGVALAFYSTSKFISGPAMTIGGIVSDTGLYDWSRPELAPLADFRKHGPMALLAKLRQRLMADVGPTLSPMNAFFQILGLETLPLRLEKQCANAVTLATWLADHPRVTGVLYPGLPTSEFHRLAAAQFRGRFGSLLAFTLEDKAACFRFLNALRLVRRATNLGDTKSLAVHPASTIYAGYWPAEQEQVGVTDDMIRLSVGIEEPQDLLADLDQALRA